MMTNIRKLPLDVISRIAAGEVVERPMNIVKELIENSIDANATEITITINEGGKELIRIQDNGDGILVDQMDLAFELHTTSKLEQDDPSIVASLGFRGEALASIAAVSRVEAVSKTSEDDQARKLIIEGGRIITDTQLRHTDGTKIEVTGLFFNTPARRKFLKATATERKRITDLVINYCLMYPQIHFKLDEITSSGVTLRVESPARKSMMAVIFDVLGPDVANELVAFDKQVGDWTLSGYISKPNLTRSDRSMQFINVNGRPVNHKTLQSTIEDAYGSQLMRKTHPVIILRVDGPIEAIDFNIHPQKSEIRFRADEKLFELIPEFILETLSNEIQLPAVQHQKLSQIRKQNEKILEKLNPHKRGDSKQVPKSPKAKLTNNSPTTYTPPVQEKQNKSVVHSPSTQQQSLFSEPIAENYGHYQVMGHIMNKFGLIYAKDELWLMDVHASDERVKFEQYSQSLTRNVSSQQFLFPVSISFSPSEKQLVLDNIEEFLKYGMKVSNGTANSLLVHSMPVYYDQEITEESISDLIVDIISHLNDDDSEKGEVENPLDVMEYNIIARLACHGSVRSGYPVSKEKIKDILNNLLKCKYPWTCAHGRPTILRLPKSRLESLFKR